MPPRSGQPKLATQLPPRPTEVGPRITTTNENWRGKNDPAERRRIQNRLNQRAFRERQRAVEAAKQQSPQGKIAAAGPKSSAESDPEDNDEDENDEDEDDDAKSEDEDEHEDDDEESSSEEGSSDEEEEDEDECDDDEAEQSNPGSPPPGPTRPQLTGQAPQRATSALATPSASSPVDELAQLINRNFMQAVTTNAQHLGLNMSALCSGTAATTPRPRNTPHLPASLKPVELQHQLPHDPLIDTIPHARLRFNILRAIATGNLDASRFSACLRRSGAVINIQGEPRRTGLVVWSSPEQLASWELSEAFILLWGYLLEGCEDFVAATNAWRGRRGERSLVVGSRPGGR